MPPSRANLCCLAVASAPRRCNPNLSRQCTNLHVAVCYDYTGTRVLKTKYMKIGVVTGITQVNGEITPTQPDQR